MVLALRADSVCPNSILSNLSWATRQFYREQNWTALATPTGAALGNVRIKVPKKRFPTTESLRSFLRCAMLLLS